MKKLLVAIGAVLLMALATLAPASSAQATTSDGGHAAPAAAVAKKGKTQCVKGSGSYSGRCFTYLSSKKKVVAVEAVPLQNKSRRTVTMNCSFSKTISRTIEAGVDLTTSAEASLFSVVKASVSVTVSMKVSQTASQATTAGGSVRLKPGQEVTCLRTYGHVVTRIKDMTYRGSDTSSKIRSVRVPSSLGVRIVD